MAEVKTNTYQGRYIKLSAWVESQSIEGNYSTIRWKLESTGGSGYYTVYHIAAWVNGQEVFNIKNVSGYNSGGDYLGWSTKRFPAATGSTEGTINVGHNADGTCGAVEIRLRGNVYSNSSPEYVDYVYPGTIARASQPRISANPTSGSAITIYTDRASTGFTHTIQYFFGNRSGTIATGVGDSTSWTPSHDLLDQIPNATSGTGFIRCLTYSGGTHIGTKDCSFTLYAASSIVPSISNVALAEGNSSVSSLNWGVHIKTMSYPTVSGTASGNKGSTITKWTLEYYTGNTYIKGIDGTSLSDLNSKIANNFDKVNQYSYKIKVTDSRGRTAYSAALTFTMLDYSAPSINASYSAERCDTSGNLKDEGTSLKIQYSGAIASVGGHNPLTVQVGIKRSDASGDYTYTKYVNHDATISSFNYTGNNRKILTPTGGVAIDHTYDVILMVSDQFTTVYRTIRIGTSFVLIDWNPNGHGIAFGKSSEKNAFEVNMDTDIKKALYINGVKMIWYE